MIDDDMILVLSMRTMMIPMIILTGPAHRLPVDGRGPGHGGRGHAPLPFRGRERAGRGRRGSGQNITHQISQLENATESPLENATESPRLFLRC